MGTSVGNRFASAEDESTPQAWSALLMAVFMCASHPRRISRAELVKADAGRAAASMPVYDRSVGAYRGTCRNATGGLDLGGGPAGAGA